MLLRSTRFIKSSNSVRPRKPYLEFPLFPHATSRWAEKIHGKMVYFGPWDDPDGALLLKQHPGKDSNVMKRRACGWDEKFLLQVRTGKMT